MSLTNRAYIRVPPDGAGKALATGHIRHLEYTGASSEQAFAVGDVVVGATSGLTATVLHVVPVSSASGAIGVSLEFGDLASDFTIGEDLTVGGVTKGVLATYENLYVSKTTIAGSNNPEFGQSVDVLGAASVRFPEGTPSFDAGGRTETSSENWVGIYQQTYDEMPDHISSTVVGGGVVAYDMPSATTELRVDDVSGSSAIRQTHLYHKYRAGVPMSAAMTVAAGAAQVGVVRRWGYFDENDGLFFEYDGADLFVVMRSSVTGSVVETRVPQSEWNGDRLDGSRGVFNPSQVTLSPSNLWLYDIGFLYLGAGPAKFSVYVGGVRTAVHTFYKGGLSDRPYMSTGTLPLRWEIFNTQATAGPAQMRQGNSTVFVNGDWAPQERVYATPFEEPVSVSGATVLAVIRAKQSVNGQDNRGIVLPSELKALSLTHPIHISVVRGGTYDITDWATEAPESLLERGFHYTVGGDPASAIPPPILTSGRVVYSHLIVPGEVGFVDLSKTFSVRGSGEVRREANVNEAVNWAIVAQALGVDATDVTASLVWREIF